MSSVPTRRSLHCDPKLRFVLHRRRQAKGWLVNLKTNLLELLVSKQCRSLFLHQEAYRRLRIFCDPIRDILEFLWSKDICILWHILAPEDSLYTVVRVRFDLIWFGNRGERERERKKQGVRNVTTEADQALDTYHSAGRARREKQRLTQLATRSIVILLTDRGNAIVIIMERMSPIA